MNKAAVFDTNVIIRYTHDDPLAMNAVLSCKKRYLSIVSWSEFLVGIKDKHRDIAESFLQKNFQIVISDYDVMRCVIDLRKTTLLHLPDAIIYGTAKHLELPLITFDKKDFGDDLRDVIVPE